MADLTVTAAKVGLVDPQRAEVFSGIAAAAITKGQAVYQTTSGTIGVADANDTDKEQARGLALCAAGAGQAVDYVKRGMVYGFTLTDQDWDDPIFLSNTAGALGDSAALGVGSIEVPVGLVVGLADKDYTKVVYLNFRWREDYS